MEDVLVIDGGVGGLNAALILSRAPAGCWWSTRASRGTRRNLAGFEVELAARTERTRRMIVATGLGCERDGNGWVRVDPSGLTSVPGVWAAGNVVDSSAQVLAAAAAGRRRCSR